MWSIILIIPPSFSQTLQNLALLHKTRKKVKIFLVYFCLSMIEEFHHGHQVVRPHIPHIDQGMGMFVPLQDVHKKGTRSNRNHLVSLQLMTILSSQGHISELLVLSQVSKG